MAGFIQILEFQTTKFDEGEKLVDEYLAKTEGERTNSRGITGRDRDRDDQYASIVWFPSYEEAMKNSEMPETSELAAGLAALSDGPPTFHNLDLVDDMTFDMVGPGFVQLIEYATSSPDEALRLRDEWVAATEGKRTLLRGWRGQDREKPGTYVNIAEFASYADAMRNSDLEPTAEFAAKMMGITDGEPTFRNLDVVRTMEG